MQLCKLCRSRYLHSLIFVDENFLNFGGLFFEKKMHRFKDFEDLNAGKFRPVRFVQGLM